MDSASIQTHPWVQSYLEEQRQLVIEFLSLQEQGGIPSDITIHHMRAWILSNTRTAFLNRFQEMVEGNHLHLIELIWKVRACFRLREIEQGVLGELQRCKSSSSIQTNMEENRLATEMASPYHERPAPSSLMSADAGKLPEEQVDLSRRSAHATLQRALSEITSRVQRAQTQTRRTPRPIVVHCQSIKHVISQVLLQENHEVFRNGLWTLLNGCPLLLDTQDLLRSFPWVQITEEKQLANALLHSSAAYQVGKDVLESLEQVLAPRPVLAMALATGSNIFSHYLVHLVARSVAQLVPDHLSADREERLVSERAAAVHPLPPKLLVSRELVEDFLVKFMLRLHPLNGCGVKQQQALLALTLEMSAVTLATLERVPGVSVDWRLRAPVCDTRYPVLQLQSAMVGKFGTVIKIKRLVATKDPDALTFIPNAVIEGVLGIYRSLSEAGPAGVPWPPRGETAKAVDDAMEQKLFSELLPETLRERLFQQYGAWVRHMATFQWAFPKTADQDVISNRRKVLRPRLSNGDVVWMDPNYAVDEEEEKVPPGSLMKNPLALDCSLAAFNRQFPKAHFFEDVTQLCQEALGQGDTGGSTHPQSGSKATYDFGPLLRPAQPWAGDCPEVQPTKLGTQSLEATPLNSRGKEEPIVPLYKGQRAEPLIQLSTVTQVLNAVLKRPSSSDRKLFDFNQMMVEHTHLLLQRETERYRHNRVFLNTLRRLTDPEREAKLAQAVASSVREKTLQSFPMMPLSRASLLDTPQTAVVFCSVVASELAAHLKPSVSFAKGTKKGDSTPYSVNHPVKRETGSGCHLERPQTRLEIQVETHLEKLRSPVVKDTNNENGALPTEYEEQGQLFLNKKKKKRSCFCGLFRW